ncbi:MAG: histidine--tRNA ligase [Chlamydiia bacterium]|nr:histidine--tRNA ligase [Chlamydiia bacterium]
MRINIPKGLFDIVPEESKAEDAWRSSDRWLYLESVIREVCQAYGFYEIRTPMFERTELFVRGVGDSSDIVSKEMYTFEDKAKRLMSLRPEGTAPVMRAFIEKGLQQQGSFHKFYYIGPYFRYDRPQAGRYRQFHQFGVEAVGNDSPEQDVEIIDLLVTLYRRLGLKEWTLLINSVGDASCRAPYREALREYLRPHFDSLSDDSKVRFEKNPLRILDTKDADERKLLEGAPSIHNYLNEACKEHFDTVCKQLKVLGIPYTVDSNLVRGLDYYNKTVFEITSSSLGAQNSISAGGRYDGLLEQLDGPNLPSTGFAGGMERLLQTMMAQGCPFPKGPHPFIFIIPLGDEAYAQVQKPLAELRHSGIAADCAPSSRKVQKGLQIANQRSAVYALVLGDEELESGNAKLKHLDSRKEHNVTLPNLIQTCKELYEN